MIYGFVLNDWADVKIDTLTSKLHERPIVKGNITKRTAIFICFTCVIGTNLTITLLFYNN
jgi:4-hydroxybenzoate polyprenyltransferase